MEPWSSRQYPSYLKSAPAEPVADGVYGADQIIFSISFGFAEKSLLERGRIGEAVGSQAQAANPDAGLPGIIEDEFGGGKEVEIIGWGNIHDGLAARLTALRIVDEHS